MNNITKNTGYTRASILSIICIVILLLVACGGEEPATEEKGNDSSEIIGTEYDGSSETVHDYDKILDEEIYANQILAYINAQRQPEEKELTIDDLKEMDLDIDQIAKEMLEELESASQAIEQELEEHNQDQPNE